MRGVFYLAVVVCGLAAQLAVAQDHDGKIAVLMTDWGEFEGWSEPYRKSINYRGRVAEPTRFPGEPCTEMHVGEYPFASQMGMIPHVLAHKTEGLEGAFDSFGVYRKSEDGSEFVAMFDRSVRVPVADVPDNLVRPMSEYRSGQPSRSLMGVDPRDGRNYLEGVYLVGSPSRGPGPNANARPNGIRDLDEVGIAASLSDRGFLSDDRSVRGNPTAGRIFHKTRATLWELFGDQLKVRFGAYAETPGFTEAHDKVAVDLANAGYTKLVLTRETTDNNNYANRFMTLGHVYKGLCKAGVWDDMSVEQVRQVGRTPEYNAAMMEVVRPQLEKLPKGSRVAILYTTYGLPWPGGATSGPFASPHPFAAEVYHENAYLNYLSFKRYLEATYGRDYQFVFTLPGKQKSSLRIDSLFSYAMFDATQFGAQDDPLRFRTLRENIDLAKKAGYEQQLVVLSHWYYNNTDTLLAIRLLQKLPFNTREELANHVATIDWCESSESPVPVDCGAESASKILLTETFDQVPDMFAVGYAHRIRGGVERYGLLPESEGIKRIAAGKVSKARGGRVVVERGDFEGASIEFPADPAPKEPERFTSASYAAFESPEAPREALWDDFNAYIAVQQTEVARNEGEFDWLSPPLTFGPYRTLMNQPATVALPLTKDAPRKLIPVIYNEVTQRWDPIEDSAWYPVVERQSRQHIEFRTHVLGRLALASPRS